MDVVPSSVLEENECPDAMKIGPVNDWPHETRLEFHLSIFIHHSLGQGL